ncbi:MAG: transcriptional regulator [Desulfobacterales bacterium]|nr:MAG: transcriptional regulator [Desulfobacterales bacterium]
MPIYEFKCNDCGKEFEQIICGADEDSPSCPECGAANLTKLISAGCVRPHGIPTGSGGYDPPPCQGSCRCSPG